MNWGLLLKQPLQALLRACDKARALRVHVCPFAKARMTVQRISLYRRASHSNIGLFLLLGSFGLVVRAKPKLRD